MDSKVAGALRPGCVAAIVALVLPAVGAEPPAAGPAKPHIVFILADDLGAGDLGCTGGNQTTPNIDRLAAEGTRFAHYYSASPICSPSRAGLITGRFPARSRLTSFLQTRAGNRGCEQADFLDPQHPSLPRALQAAGYATAHFGKWHLGGGRDVTEAPAFAAYGYDEHAGTYESPQPHPDITATNWIWSPQDKVKRWDRTAFFVDRTLDFLERHHGRPCFVNLWIDDPHTPWVPGPDPPGPESPAALRQVLAEIDRQVGRLMEGLRAQSLDQQTLVIFASDNGPLPTIRGARSAGRRGSKLSLYEGGIQVPFIARWPGHVPAGRVDEETVLAAVDLFPTLCAIAGADGAGSSPGDGENMRAAFEGRSVTRSRPLFWEYGRNAEFFKFPRNPRDRSPNLAVRDGRWKLLVNADGTEAQLFDMIMDRSESTDVAAGRPEVTGRLTAMVMKWRESLPR